MGEGTANRADALVPLRSFTESNGSSPLGMAFRGDHNEVMWLSWQMYCRPVWTTIRIGYRLRWRSDIWRTDRGVAEVHSPGIRPATDDDIRHNAPGLLETVDQLLRTKVRRKLLNQDKPSRLASYALQQHKAKFARLAASEFSFLLAVL